ncbi:hypothetical protein F511_32347 [Dorcoceras hygrometricum]|uniref:Uncharacterized protein n=1 Tax=Dorcoceras hygrometricum TaxID=472368 RepID=A0A2Z7D5D8_9LAMI|nr:hypothetical protein F511_32347 [Dorcoceras hygrometricum]
MTSEAAPDAAACQAPVFAAASEETFSGAFLGLISSGTVAAENSGAAEAVGSVETSAADDYCP